MSECVQMTDEYNVVNEVMKGYNTNVRPVNDPSQPIVVKLGMALNQIIDLVIWLNKLNHKMLLGVNMYR